MDLTWDFVVSILSILSVPLHVLLMAAMCKIKKYFSRGFYAVIMHLCKSFRSFEKLRHQFLNPVFVGFVGIYQIDYCIEVYSKTKKSYYFIKSS